METPQPDITLLETQQTPKTEIPSLLDLSSSVIAKNIERNFDQYVEHFKTIPTQYLTPIFQKISFLNIKESEDRFRHLFAVDRDNSELSDCHLMLMNVHKNGFDELFTFQNGNPEELSIPRVLSKKKIFREGARAINNKQEFQRFFDLFTENQLKGINWDNIFVAGGSVLAALTPFEKQEHKRKHRSSYHGYQYDKPKVLSNKWIREQFQTLPKYANSDVDLFIYGLSAEQATEKVNELYNVISEAISTEMFVLRTPQTVTFVSQYPLRYIQIILRLYKSPAEILMGFDIDSCTVGYDGKDVYCLPRFYRAMTRRYNLVDLDRRSTTYETRLVKYSLRGFEVAIPNYRPELVTKNIRSFDGSFKGLAKLLRYQWIIQMKHSYADCFSLTTPTNKLRAPGEYGEVESNRAAEIGALEDTFYDYTTTFIPWGRDWNCRRIQLLFHERKMSLEYGREQLTSNWVTGPDVESILLDPQDRYEDEEEAEDVDSMETDRVLKKLPKGIKWLTVEPGRQYIGSFHPETEEDWFKDAYQSPWTDGKKQFVEDKREKCSDYQNCPRRNPQHLKDYAHYRRS